MLAWSTSTCGASRHSPTPLDYEACNKKLLVPCSCVEAVMEAAVAAAMRHTVAPTASCRDPGQAHCSAAAAQSHDDAVIRLQYSMIIVRLVNGIADAGQKGRTANSVASITAAAGAPNSSQIVAHPGLNFTRACRPCTIFQCKWRGEWRAFLANSSQ